MRNFRVFDRVCIAALVVCLLTANAHALIEVVGQTTGEPAKLQHPGLNHNCVDTINPNPIERLSGASALAITALERDFDDWNFGYNYDQDWTGELDILTYEAVDYSTILNPHVMGAHLSATYSHEGPPIDRFRWIQIIDTNAPMTGAESPYVDPFPGDDDKPFYWMEGENPPHDFSDWPRRPCPEPGLTTWRAELYLADWFGPVENKTVVLYEGIRWGFNIYCAPEPATAVLLGLGYLVLLRGRRR